jgi:hypothetical protein
MGNILLGIRYVLLQTPRALLIILMDLLLIRGVLQALGYAVDHRRIDITAQLTNPAG